MPRGLRLVPPADRGAKILESRSQKNLVVANLRVSHRESLAELTSASCGRSAALYSDFGFRRGLALEGDDKRFLRVNSGEDEATLVEIKGNFNCGKSRAVSH